MICKNTIHSVNCPSYKNNSLKDASAVVAVNNNYNNKNNPKKYTFDTNEVSILSKTLEVSRYFISKNSGIIQNPNDILKEVNQSLQILKPANGNSLKGASNICPKQSLTNILKLFGLN